MKKLLGILVVGLLWCNALFAEDHYQTFMTECNLTIKQVKEKGFVLTHVSSEEGTVHLFLKKVTTSINSVKPMGTMAIFAII